MGGLARSRFLIVLTIVMAVVVGKSGLCTGAPAGSMRVATYNILWGGEGDHKGRLRAIRDWLLEMSDKIDLVAFQECNGWQDLPPSFAMECGFQYL